MLGNGIERDMLGKKWKREMAMLRFVTLWLIWLVLPLSSATAQDIPLWGHKIIGQIYTAQFNNGCFSQTPETPSVYLLGVIPSDTFLDEQSRVELVSRLESILSAQGNIRFRSAGAFQPIAYSANSGSETKRTELRKLVEGASDADMTVLLRPYAKRGPNVEIRVMFWARDGKAGARKLTCTPAITISYKTGTTDSACSNAWKRAVRANTITKYQGFVDYLGHCPEADEADQRIKTLERQQQEANAQTLCRNNLARARQVNTSKAYEAYLGDNPNCPNADFVYARLQDIRKSENEQLKAQACAKAFDVARSTKTPEAFDAYLAANTSCPQRDAALSLRDALIVHKNAQDALKKAQRNAGNSGSGNTNRSTGQRRVTSSRSSSCGDLWYERNLIFHNRGYRFKTARGKRTFGTGGYTSNPKLSSRERRRVQQIKRMERQKGC